MFGSGVDYHADAARQSRERLCPTNTAKPLKSPAHPIGGPLTCPERFGFTLDNDLGGPFRTATCRKIDRPLNPDRPAIGAETPAISIPQYQKCAHPVARQRGFDAGMQVEADGKTVSPVDIIGWSVLDGPEQTIFTAKVAAIGCQE